MTIIILSTCNVGFWDILTIIISLATLYVANLARIEFVKNHAKSKQVEKMSELVEYLNKTKISLIFASYENTGITGGENRGLYYNVFEIGSLHNAKEITPVSKRKLYYDDYDDYDDCPVFLHPEITQIADFAKFIDNPFIPRNIADQLSNFFVLKVEKTAMIDYEKKMDGAAIVILNANSCKVEFFHLNQPECEALRSWLNFKTYSYDLTKLIESWFQEKGVEDFNLRIDYKNVMTMDELSGKTKT